ncbi:hypothetical protein P154DRAFT_544913 [Amniculicola lignicola CBS 123094]|uniref:gamma-glutamylcyclotransferase n=1 Tax=Amniculicola lignicola CBS 123094 TaxID=1392246 RepID=A0A6A5WRR8_9PLEO|nr:hypothetical protein P154DRAFT_544913 [Amniculicola lignicola CBS 123094]
MQSNTPGSKSNVGNDSWLVSAILWFDRKPRTAEGSPLLKRPVLPVCDPRSNARNVCRYLAYGSNLCASTFQDNRGIQPISAVNVIVPELRLAWDVPGIPYVEPCYANAKRRPGHVQSSTSRPLTGDRDPEALVGVVYEISADDFAHILRTEGQGYMDTEVECFRLQVNTNGVTACPREPPFKAHAVLARDTTSKRRQDMQPSSRYLGLLVTGAREHNLPKEHVASLQSVATYKTSTVGQCIGKSLFAFFWFIPVLVGVALERQMADENGKIPGWVNSMVDKCYLAMWWTHDYLFGPLFGDGARSVH